MAFLDPNEIFFTPFEPKMKNRFIMEIDGIPAYLIKTASRPQVNFETVTLDHMNVKRYLKGKASWQTLNITLYDPITPSGAQAVNEWIREHHEATTGVDGYASEYKKDIVFNLFSPNGEKIEQWVLKGAFIESANFNEVSWESNAEVDIALTLRYDYAILEF